MYLPIITFGGIFRFRGALSKPNRGFLPAWCIQLVSRREPLAVGKWSEWMNRSGASSYSKVLRDRVLGSDLGVDVRH